MCWRGSAPACSAASVCFGTAPLAAAAHPRTAAPAPFPQVAFTGHSLGGSLGTLLMLMFVRRGVLPRSAVSPVYTFGAPAIFCEGGAGGACDCGAPPGVAPAGDEQPQHEAGACSAAAGTAGHSGVLGLLDLPEGAIRNVLMVRGRRRG